MTTPSLTVGSTFMSRLRDYAVRVASWCVVIIVQTWPLDPAFPSSV